MSRLKEMTADGDIDGTTTWQLHSVVLTAGSDAATVAIKDGGSGGTTVLTLKAAASTTASWRCGDPGGVQITRPYADLTGTSPVADIELS